MAVIFNAKGTTSPYFLLGKGGTTLYQGSSDPTGSYTASAGDVWFDTNANTLKFRNTGNNAWTQGSIDITGNATISGNLTINGTTTILDTTNITVEDPLMLLSSGAAGSPSADAGFVIERGSSTNVGIIWDESADQFAAINTTEAGSTAGNVNIASYANIRADTFVGALTGNASGTAATVTGAAQAAITSLGTLTTLTVDNVIVNGTTIGHTSDIDLMTLSSGTLDIAGTLDANNITISSAQGSDGQILTSTGSGVAWEDAAGGGGSTDISGLQNDLSTLALYVITTHDQVAYNLPNTFIDHYEDNSSIDTTSTVMYTEGTHLVTGNPGAGLTNYAPDSNTELLIHFDGNNNDNIATTEASKNAGTLTVTSVTVTTSSVDRAPVGGGAGYVPSANSKIVLPGASWMNTEANFTIEFWVRTDAKTDSPVFDFNTQDDHDNEQMCFEMTFAEGGAEEMSFETGGGLEYGGHYKWIFPTLDCDDNTWHHYAVTRDLDEGDDGRWWFYYDGVSQTATGSSDSVTDSVNENINRDERPMNFFKSINYTSGRFTGAPCRIDEFRFSSTCRYPSGTTFVPNPGPITTATGNYTSSTETANATVSNMGIVVLYKNASGTATLDTDLIAEVSANGGTNWTSAPLTAGGTFSTGILIAKSNDITISNTGTTPKYRISFANQSSGSKVTQMHGASLLY